MATFIVGELVHAAPTEIRVSPTNPPSRTSPEKMKTLRESIAKHGILSPILVTPGGEIIDGHRRRQCAIDLGLRSVPVLAINADKDEIYSDLAETARRISGYEWMQRYLRGGNVPAKFRTILERTERIGGQELLQRMEKEFITPRIMDVASRIVGYVGHPREDDAFMLKALLWLVKGRRIWTARRAMEQGIPPQKLETAVLLDQEIRIGWTINED